MACVFGTALRAACLAAVLVLGGCQMNQRTAENALSTSFAVFSALDTSPERQRYDASRLERHFLDSKPASRQRAMAAHLQRIVDDMARANGIDGAWDWRVHLLADMTPNAFTPGGGVIFVNDGLLTQAPEEAMIAMVLAHEMAHVTEAHVATRNRDTTLMQVGSIWARELGLPAVGDPTTTAFVDMGGELLLSAMVSGYSRSAESAADALGFRYFVNAGYRPDAADDMFVALDRLSGSAPAIAQFFHGTHPEAGDRARRLRGMALDLPIDRQVSGIEQTATYARLWGPYRTMRPK